MRRANLAFTSEETESVCAIVTSHTHDERLSQSIQFSPTIISHIRRLLVNGGSIITDTELLARSISELPGMADNDKVSVRCFIDDPEVIVRAVNMHVYALCILSVYISGDIRALVNDKDRFSVRLGFMCKYRSVKSGTYHKIIVFFSAGIIHN